MSEEPLKYDNAPLHMGRLCHLIEQSEERILQSNAILAKLGAAGIFTDQIVLGPLIAYVGVNDIVRHLVSPTFIRSAVCPHEGLGVVMFNADIVPLPRASEGWDLFPAHEDDRNTKPECCSVLLSQLIGPPLRILKFQSHCQ